MTFNVWTFLFEVLNFVVLAAVLHRLLYRPLREAIDKRHAETERARTEAESARKQADTARDQLTAKLAEVDRERLEVLRAAAEQAAGEKAKQIAAAGVEAKLIHDRAMQDAEQLRKDALASLEGAIGNLAVGLADRLLREAGDSSLNRQLTLHLMDTVRAIPADERDRVRREGNGADGIVESSQLLDDATRTSLTTAVQELRGSDLPLRYEVNPKLICGSRLQIGGRVWDATVVEYLNEAKAALKGSGDGQPG